jgi:DNA-directed RNA polymerase specialized sigma24 family protein
MVIFPTTQWSHDCEAKQRAGSGADSALARVCQAYWYPIYSFIRSHGHTEDVAADLTQDYFARLMEGRLLAVADRRHGRFRALLRTDCRFFLADMRDRASSEKRGGGVQHFSLDAALADYRYRIEPVDRLEPEHLFDRAWALEVLARALERLGHEETECGRGVSFGYFRDLLTDAASSPSYAQLGVRLNRSEAAIEGAVRRLRSRYRQALRATVAETRDHPTEAEIDEEILDLFAALAR